MILLILPNQWEVTVIRYFIFISVSVMVLFITACTGEESAEDPPETEEEMNGEETADQEENGTEQTESDTEVMEERTVIADNLDEPWEIQLYEDAFYVSERTGSIVTIQEDEENRKPVDQNLSNHPEAGLLGMVLPDAFSETSIALAYYSYEEDGNYFQRVVTVEEMEQAWVEREVLLDDIPGGEVHQGGRIAIGPDEMLYITTGDAAEPELAQDPDSLAGKILRMELDGSIPDDNPFDDSYVYSYGHRNAQGLAWTPDGELYATEHGAEALDEINRINKGNNYGWPRIEGDEEEEGMETPVIHSGDDTWAPSGMAYVHDHFYFAALRGESVRQFDPVEETVEVIVSDVGRVRDVLAAENGIYFITNNTDGRGNPEEEDDRLIFEPIPESEAE
ncbi:PQQ-dependent sugar dehydrogenase [Virgibacillus kimchii]